MQAKRFIQSTRRGWLVDVRRRLAKDFQLLMMALFVGMAVVLLLPLFFYRLALGDWPAAIGNLATILPLVGAFIFAWVTGRTVWAARLIAVAMTVVCAVMVIWVHQFTHWVFPAMVANFMLAGWRFALVANIIMVAAIAVAGPAFDETAEMVSFLGAVAMVGMFAALFVIETRLHRDRLTELVARDSLTGALSRRVLRHDLHGAIREAGRRQVPATVALLDLDNFKQVNDNQGHEVGDRVLVDLTELVNEHCRQSDRFYRLGGEEFVLLLSQTGRRGAEVALDKLLQSLREQLKTPAGPVTVSIGVAVYRPEETWSQWLARADQAMYHAKSEGKDRVVFAD